MPSPSTPRRRRLRRRTAGRQANRAGEKDPRAAYDLGLRYFRGDGVRQDSYQALKWMRDAAERGYLKAQTAVGRLYLMGLEEMGSDPAEAEKWLSIAAGRGDKEAKTLLAQATRQSRMRWRIDAGSIRKRRSGTATGWTATNTSGNGETAAGTSTGLITGHATEEHAGASAPGIAPKHPTTYFQRMSADAEH
jgi:TPR repeat protein